MDNNKNRLEIGDCEIAVAYFFGLIQLTVTNERVKLMLFNKIIDYREGWIVEEQILQYRDAVYEQVVKVGKSLGNVTRLRILDLLVQGPKTVENLANTIGLSVATTSRNLQILKKARLVEIERHKNFVTYRLTSDQIKQLISLLVTVAEQSQPELAAIQTTFKQQTGSPQALTISALKAKLTAESTYLVDLRPNDEYETQHLPGAHNIPYDELPQHLAELPQDKDIVVYCRGRLCAYANVASQALHDAGFKVATFNQSVWEWNQLMSS